MLQSKISYEDFNMNSNNQNQESNNNYNSNNNSALNDGLYSNGIAVGNRVGSGSYEPDNKSISSTPSKISKFTYSGRLINVFSLPFN
jgi:hypothetical protein